MVRSTTNYGGQKLPSEVWTKLDYLNREQQGHKPGSQTSKVSKPEGQDMGKPVNPRKDPKLKAALEKDLKARNMRSR